MITHMVMFAGEKYFFICNTQGYVLMEMLFYDRFHLMQEEPIIWKPNIW